MTGNQEEKGETHSKTKDPQITFPSFVTYRDPCQRREEYQERQTLPGPVYEGIKCFQFACGTNVLSHSYRTRGQDNSLSYISWRACKRPPIV